MKYGIAYTADGEHPDSVPPTPITGWKQKDGNDQTWDTYGAKFPSREPRSVLVRNKTIKSTLASNGEVLLKFCRSHYTIRT